VRIFFFFGNANRCPGAMVKDMNKENYTVVNALKLCN